MIGDPGHPTWRPVVEALGVTCDCKNPRAEIGVHFSECRLLFASDVEVEMLDMGAHPRQP